MDNEFFSSSSSMPDVFIYWGAGDIDRTGENIWDSEFIGQISFDPNFNPASECAQTFLSQFCKSIRNQKDIVSPGEDSVKCWIEDFSDNYLTEFPQVIFPIPEEDTFYWHVQDFLKNKTFERYN